MKRKKPFSGGIFTYENRPLKAKKKLCADCVSFLKKFRPWNERKVPGACIITHAECAKCKVGYEIYKNMARMRLFGA